MLLRHETHLNWNLNLHLYFDDNTEKQDTIEEGYYILLKFRRDNNKYNRAGRVVKIDPVMVRNMPPSFTGTLVVDFSGRYNASRVRIDAGDILDYRIVSEEQIRSLGPDYLITDEMFKTSYILPINKENINGVGCAGCNKAEVIL